MDPNAPVRFAVDMFDLGESAIGPGRAAAIEGLGRATPPSPGPGATPSTDRPVAAGSTSRDEVWVPIVLIVLVGLCVEWLVYNRDGLIRLRRGLAARFGRGAPDGTT